MAIRDKTQTKMLKVYKEKPITQIMPIITNPTQPNYYLSVASVDSSMTESTYIFPEILKQNA